ncbi:hypothetical protein vBBceHLY2_00137 [Bacillus phage vB_BceH_LY2]|nr:hypothetical protein vBBceHLY2_00137 [Bacillus phage vB_BceH_LY2]
MIAFYLVVCIAFLIAWSLATYIGFYCFIHGKERGYSRLSRFLWFVGACISGYSAGKSLGLVIMLLYILI